MLMVSQVSSRWRRFSLAGFARARAGTTALEFAIVAIPFLFLLLATLELSLIFVANTSLQNATFSAARQIRVGELLAPGMGQTSSNGSAIDLADFKSKICKNMPLMPASSCAANLFVDVRELTNFTGSMAPSPFSGATLNSNNFCFYSGASGSIVEMRVYYLWQVFTPLLLSPLVNTNKVVTSSGFNTGNWFALSSHEVFRNEPGSSAGNTGASC